MSYNIGGHCLKCGKANGENNQACWSCQTEFQSVERSPVYGFPVLPAGGIMVTTRGPGGIQSNKWFANENHYDRCRMTAHIEFQDDMDKGYMNTPQEIKSQT